MRMINERANTINHAGLTCAKIFYGFMCGFMECEPGGEMILPGDKSREPTKQEIWIQAKNRI
jgi:hypothetical protein